MSLRKAVLCGKSPIPCITARLIRRPWFFVYAAWWENKEGVIQSGGISVRSGHHAAPDILQQLVAGNVYQYSITLVEGWTVTQALRSLRAQTAIHPRADENGQPLSGEQIMGVLKEADIPPEGAFYPDTYHFPRGADGVGHSASGACQIATGVKRRMAVTRRQPALQESV